MSSMRKPGFWHRQDSPRQGQTAMMAMEDKIKNSDLVMIKSKVCPPPPPAATAECMAAVFVVCMFSQPSG